MNSDLPLTSELTNQLLASVASIPRDNEGPVFEEPWQAEVFAITLTLYEKGLFSWRDWADHLSNSIASAQANGDPDLGDTYYLHWLDALESIIIAKGLGSHEQLSDLYAKWEHAAESTPHGKAIVLTE